MHCFIQAPPSAARSPDAAADPRRGWSGVPSAARAQHATTRRPPPMSQHQNTAARRRPGRRSRSDIAAAPRSAQPSPSGPPIQDEIVGPSNHPLFTQRVNVPLPRGQGVPKKTPARARLTMDLLGPSKNHKAPFHYYRSCLPKRSPSSEPASLLRVRHFGPLARFSMGFTWATSFRSTSLEGPINCNLREQHGIGDDPSAYGSIILKSHAALPSDYKRHDRVPSVCTILCRCLWSTTDGVRRCRWQWRRDGY
jgi:hypothetical protein